MTLENVLPLEMIQRLGWALLHFCWQATAVALLLAILLAALRKATSNVRYIISCIALGLIVLLPIATMSLVPVSTPQPIVNIAPPSAPVIVQMQPTNVETSVAKVVEVEEPVQAESIEVTPKIPWRQRATEKLEASHPYLVAGWLIGVFGLSLWHLGGWAQLQRLKRHMVKPVEASLQTKLNTLAERLRISRAVRLVESALVQVPTVVGWMKPVILLPASALTGLSSEQLDAILAHELAHIKRLDYLVNMLQTVVEILVFYHPAVWWISHKIRIERENCCDDFAIVATGDRVRYARALTSMEEIRSRNSELVMTATGGNLFSRIRRLIGKESSEKTFSWIPAATVVVLLVTLIISTTLALTKNEKFPTTELNTNNSVKEPSNAKTRDSSTKVLIEAQIIYVTNEFLEQVGLDVNSLKRSDSWMQYRVDDSVNPSMFVIDSPTKEMLQKNIDESDDSSSISRFFLMTTSGREAMIKNYSGYVFKSQELGRFIKIKPTISQDGHSTYVDCELMTRQFKNLDLFFDVYINKKVDQNDVSESEVVEHQSNASKALLSDDHTLLILGGKLVSFQDVENGTPIVRDIPVIGKFFNTISKIKVEKNEIILIKTTLAPTERSDDIDSKASLYNVAKIGSKTSELLRIYLDLYLEPGQYVEMKDSNQREPIIKQVDTSSIGKSAKDFPAYASYIDFEIRSNVDLNLATQRFTRGSFFFCEHDKWDAYFTGPDTIIGNGHFSSTTLCISAWRAKLWLSRTDDDNKPSLVAVIIKPKNKQQKSSTKIPTNALPTGWSLKYIEDSDVGGNRVVLKAIPKPIDENDQSWKQERLEFRIRSPEGKLADTISFRERLQRHQVDVEPDKYVLKYERRWGESGDNFRIWREFPVDLNRPGIYELQFIPRLGTAEITGARGGCYAVNFEKADQGPEICGFAYRNAGKGYRFDGLPPGTYKLSAVTQRQSDNVFISQAEVTISAEEKTTVNIASPPRGSCSLKGRLLGKQRKYKAPWQSSPESPGRWFVLIRRFGCGPIEKTKAYEALTMDSLYVVRGRNIVQETKDQALYHIEGMVPGRYTVTAIEHPWWNGCTITRQQSKTLVLKDGENAVLDFDLIDIPKDDTPMAVETERPIEKLRQGIESDKVVLKLVDPNSRPVVSARVGTYVDWSDMAENPPIWFLRDGRTYRAVDVESDEHGKVTLEAEDLFRPEWSADRKAPLTAIDAGHYFAGLQELSREDLGKEITLMLQPGCRVRGRVSAATARKRKWSTKTLTVYVDWGEYRPCQYTSKRGRFEFVLPEGTYNLKIYAEDPDEAVILPIQIKPGQRNLDLTKYLDGTSKLPAADTELSPEFILEKMLEHRSRVKNLQYIAEDVIWRDPATEKVLIEEHIKRMREKGIRERQLERWRERMSQIPETRYQILKCTVDDAGHTKIELTTGTFDSSGKKVPREEKHVWAWNGVLETEFTQRDGSPGSAIFKDKPNISITLGHPWRSFTGIFCGFLEETIKAKRPVSAEELKDGTYRVGFDYKTSRYVAIVDPSKGYTCSLRETYNKQGQLNSRTTAIYEEVAEGIWFPVSGQREDYTAEGSLYHKSTAKSAQIRINDPAFNAGYFDVDIPKGAPVRDFTQNAEKPETYRYGEPRKTPVEDHNETIEIETIVEKDEGRIEGRIIDIHTGKGIAGTNLTTVLRDSSASEKQHLCTSGEDGAFSFRNLKSGEYKLQGDFPSLDVDVASNQSIRDVLIGVDRRDALQPPKDRTTDQHSDIKIKIGLRVIEMTANVMKEAFEANESIPSELFVRSGHEITDRLLTLTDERKDAKLIANPQLLMLNNKTASISSMEHMKYISGYEPAKGEPNKLSPKQKTLDGGFKYTFHAGTLEGGQKVHIETTVWHQELDFETRQYRPGYDIQIPSLPNIFATATTAKNSEPFVIGRVRHNESAFCLIVTPTVILPEPQPESLLGKKFPESADMEILKQAGKKGVLICFWDMNQRPSRNMITELAKRSKELRTKGIFTMLVHTSPVEPAKLKEWLDNHEILFPYYSRTEAISPQELFRWGVRAQPWLILTDEEGIVQAEGPSIEQLDEILRQEIAKQIAEWDVFQAVKPRIIELQNSDPVQMARLLTTLFAEEDEDGVNIRKIILSEDVKAKYNIVGLLSRPFTFEAVPGTNKIIIISNIPRAYDAVAQWILELDKQKMATKDVEEVREWIARLVSNGRLGESNISRVGIQIETRILTIDDCFFEDLSLDVNSVDNLKSWPEYFAHDSGNLASLILDQRRVDLLLNAAMNHEGAKMLMSPRILVREDEEASVFTGQEIPRVSGYAEPNEPSKKPTPEFEYVKMGTSIRIKAHLMPDKSKVYLDVKSETTQIRGFKKRTFMDRYTHMVPQIHTTSLGTGNTIPLGKTLLIGQRIRQDAHSKLDKPILAGVLPVERGLPDETSPPEPTVLLMLLKPEVPRK